MQPGTFFIIGVGHIGLQLLKMLSREFDPVCIDRDEHALELAREIRGESLTTLNIDATSRLALEEAGVEEADAVVITTTTEKINIEVARVLHDHFRVPRVISIGISRDGIAELERLGVEVEGIFAVSATGLRNRLEHRSKAVHGIGLGKNEILEVEVDPNSRLVNKPLGHLRPKNWRVGLIYREGNIVLPRPTTPLRPKDRVVILGEPKVLRTVAERLSFSAIDFPLEYGDTALVLPPKGADEAFFGEIAYLASTLPFQRFLFLRPSGAPEPPPDLLDLLGDKPVQNVATDRRSALDESIAEALQKHRCNPGLVVIGETSLGRSPKTKRRLLESFEQAACPVLVAAGTFPYRRVAAPCLDRESCQQVLETGLSIATALYSGIEALLVPPSPYITSAEAAEDYKQIGKTISDLGLIYKASIGKIELPGNPIRAVTRLPGEETLLVSGVGEAQPRSVLRELFNPDVAWAIASRPGVSRLLLPPLEVVL